MRPADVASADVSHEDVVHYGGRQTTLENARFEDAFDRRVCGHCGTAATVEVLAHGGPNAWVRCTACGRGSVAIAQSTFGRSSRGVYVSQYPPPRYEARVEHLPEDVSAAFHEATTCLSTGAFTGAEAMCRKLLAHVAVDLGAAENLSFVEYVTHIEKEGAITPMMRPWADKICSNGNAAMHDLERVTPERAQSTYKFTVQLLRIVYEMPAEAGAEPS